jgi:hypothetical protein
VDSKESKLYVFEDISEKLMEFDFQEWKLRADRLITLVSQADTAGSGGGTHAIGSPKGSRGASGPRAGTLTDTKKRPLNQAGDMPTEARPAYVFIFLIYINLFYFIYDQNYFPNFFYFERSLIMFEVR